jgi:hypothetical protein
MIHHSKLLCTSGVNKKVTRNIDKINASANSKQQYNALLKSNQYYKN